MQRRQDEPQCRSAYFPLPAIQKGHGDQLTSEHREKWNKFLFRQAVFSVSALSTQTSQASVKRYCFHFPSDSISFQTFCSSTWFSLVGQQQLEKMGMEIKILTSQSLFSLISHFVDSQQRCEVIRD